MYAFQLNKEHMNQDKFDHELFYPTTMLNQNLKRYFWKYLTPCKERPFCNLHTQKKPHIGDAVIHCIKKGFHTSTVIPNLSMDIIN